MPRRRQSSHSRSEASLDGSKLSADELLFIAAQIGRLWKRFRRRRWPDNIKDSIAAVLLELRAALTPSGALDEFGACERTPSDIRGLTELMACLATRSTFLENKSSKLDSGTRSRSSPPTLNLNTFMCSPPPAQEINTLELQLVADVSDVCNTDWEFYEYGVSDHWYADGNPSCAP